MVELRRELPADLSGMLVEVGAGNGLNFAHYSAAVTEGIAVEPEPYLRDLATQAAQRAPVPVTVLPGTAEQPPLPSSSAAAVLWTTGRGSRSPRAPLPTRPVLGRRSHRAALVSRVGRGALFRASRQQLGPVS